jgi:hypothetical protein
LESGVEEFGIKWCGAGSGQGSSGGSNHRMRSLGPTREGVCVGLSVGAGVLLLLSSSSLLLIIIIIKIIIIIIIIIRRISSSNNMLAQAWIELFYCSGASLLEGDKRRVMTELSACGRGLK